MRDTDKQHSDETPTQSAFDIEAAVLTVLFAALLLLGLIRLALHPIGISLGWVDGATSALLLWLVMTGAVVASGNLRHVRIELLELLIPARTRIWIRRAILLGTALTCALLAWISLRFVALEYEFQQAAFLDLPAWTVLIVIPAGFALMAARFAAWAVAPVRRADSASATGR